MEYEHPLLKFWREESGWYSSNNPTPEEGLSEGTLCIETWNKAIETFVDIAGDESFGYFDSYDLDQIETALKYTPEK